MASFLRRSSVSYELLPRNSSDSSDRHGFEEPAYAYRSLPAILSWLPFFRTGRQPTSAKGATAYRFPRPRRHRGCLFRSVYWALIVLPYFLIGLVLFVAAFIPSYTHRPAHYNELRARSEASSEPGRANINQEKVFIAASVYDEDGMLAGGAWGDAIIGLVDLLGPENVYLSVYENDPDPGSKKALEDFEKRVTCNSSIVAEHLGLDSIPRVTLPSGEKRVKRIAFLAEVRNRALRPLETAGITFDKLFFINDVVFDPIEAAQLLFSTKVDSNGRTQYGAACAVDFINPFKFYDRFATRDLDGYSMGIPFFPWVTDAGSGGSRRDLIANKDAVRVRSCWGGMTAFEARWFQTASITSALSTSDSPPSTSPLRFRFEEDIFWDSSECCLINADLQHRRSGLNVTEDTGIYMNPFVRVAYDSNTLSWLALTRRPERLYSLIHNILSHMVGMPLFNPRRTEQPGEQATDKVWQYDNPDAVFSGNLTVEGFKGAYHDVKRLAGPGGFCASVICVDVIVRQFPGQKNFKIQNSNNFLSCSLSLSFGVMIFSSLYSMLPSAKQYLHKSGLSPKVAAWITIGCFLAGVIGIQLISRVIHRYIPHETVDCDHAHDEEEGEEIQECDEHQKSPQLVRDPGFQKQYHLSMGSESAVNTDLDSEQLHGDHTHVVNGIHHGDAEHRRPSLQQLVSGLVTGSKRLCDEDGQCFGYSDPCGQDCFKIVQSRGGTRAHPPLARPAGLRTMSTPHTSTLTGERQPLLQSVNEGAPLTAATEPSHSHNTTKTSSNGSNPSLHKHPSTGTLSTQSSSTSSLHKAHTHPSHHHHVPTNAFLSIGLQTSIAIALHKLPEGFITYATNHANPSLGAAVFLALFIHNLTEGFTLALPMYLAIGSRWKAMFWSSLLGGASQPLGAGVAALWIRFSGRGADGDDARVYGCMFAVTAGIMASVAVQLLSESLDLTHSKNACFVFAFVGMAVLGVSSALTA
ncbi:uncharacterized protein BDZ99DRAFT_512056 [Mytilinidion resinicola]|uniref:Glycosyltransferase family 69 protein n=1 Tax=Mytilinidion resinicola TaxID=574789 RepID=A0A6A6Y4A5_9PEZI|nr:uncharacterized protein BDZ99DRAFT_512056 [Mytilinidion resinicola]KAF2803622.1 hypothetical protein BDZ99DRAFT_512056 [Mytilinidion resinicola]